MSLTFLVLSILWGTGAFFGAGAALGVLALLAATYWEGAGKAQPFLLLAAVAFAGGVLFQRCYRRAGVGAGRWTRPSPTAVLIAAVIVLLGALPVGSKISQVRSEQRRIETVIPRPLQPDVEDAWPTRVSAWDSGFEYSVRGPWSDGTWGADVTVTVRRATPDQAPCTGFTERPEGRPATATGCTEIQPGLWTGRGPQGQQRYFVHDPSGQWAYVRSGTYGPDSQWRYDLHAAEVATTLEPRSAFPLAAEAAYCGFCEWLG